MTVRIPIRRVLSLRGQASDQTLLDYLQLVIMAPDAGLIRTSELRLRWRCSQSQVSRRMAAVAAAGLADITTGQCGYQVHQVHRLEVVA